MGVLALIRARGGGPAVELALLAPVLILVLLVTVELSFGLWQSMALEAAVRAGTEQARIAPDDDTSIIAAVRSGTGNNVAGLTVTVSRLCSCAANVAVACTGTCADGFARRRYVTVLTRQPRSTPIDTPDLVLPATLSATATVRVE